MAGAAAKRKLKRLKREGDEGKEIVDQIMGLFMAHGVAVNFPWEIPNVIAQLLQNQGTVQGMPTQQQAIEQNNQTLDRLRQLTSGAPVAPAYTPPQVNVQAPPPTPAAPHSDPWAAAAGSGGAPHQSAAPPPAAPPADPWEAAASAPIEFSEPPPQMHEAYTPDFDETDDDGLPMSPEEMKARYEAGLANMVNRVATEGVRYKHGAAGPAAGQRIAPAPGALPTQATPAAPQAPPAPAPGPRGPGGGKRGMNGLTTEEARNILSRVTGRDIKPPGASPIPKPPGM